ncbi:hypothetical protein ACQSSU_13035 [Micromonospora echinospora]
MTTSPSIPVVLFTAADAIARDGLPLPLAVNVSDRHGLELTIGTHVELYRWAEHMALTVKPWNSQRYDRDNTPEVLTNVYGCWRDFRVRLSCCEPIVTAPAALVEAVTA